MKHFKNLNDERFSFELNCFDEQQNCINEDVKRIISENNLVETTEEENAIYLATKENERLAVLEERMELLEAQELTDFFEKFQKLIDMGVIQ